MTELLLKRELEPAAQQKRRVAMLRRLAIWWATMALVAFGFIIAQHYFVLPSVWVLLGVGAIAAIGMFAVSSSRLHVDYKRLARNIAEQNPELHALLMTAIEQERDANTGRLTYLQERVLNEALVEVRHRENLKAVSRGSMAAAQLFHAAAAIAFLIALAAMPRHSTALPAKPVDRMLATRGVEVSPGNTNIERGSALVVLAKFGGNIPAEATLVVDTNGGEFRTPLTKNLRDPVFGGSVPEVRDALKYHVEYTGGRTPDYNVKVFDFPKLERSDVSLKFPDYTGLEPKKIADTRRVTAVEGSMLDLSLQLNKPVRLARLIGADKSILPLNAQSNVAHATLDQFRLAASQKYELQLVDEEGRTNKVSAQFAFDVLTNQRPQLKIAFPRGDQRVSSLQEMAFQAEAQDDFGLRGWGITYSIGGEEAKSVVLGESAPGHFKTNFTHMVRLEDLHVEPDQLVSYFVWADDLGPDGEVRRTSSDLFFAEVRPFDEIFRQGDSAADSQQQQQQQQQQQNGNQSASEKLAELQKQIINATWKVQRRETGTNLSPVYLKDTPLIKDSQERALDQVSTLQEDLQDFRLKQFAESAEKHMSDALKHLELATNSPTPLPEALAAEQAAYQDLLKLQAREFQVRQAQNQSGNQRSSRERQQQAQLNQLDLKKQQNRYEMQREATAPQQPQKKEQLEVLNRLKELAQRQEDINERLKELQTELQAAKTQQQKEELQRQLKRLREEQREMLADMDEVRQKMEQQQNNAETAEPRQQLDQARQEAQRASEALEQNSVPQALSAGTRAERQLEKVRDDMRKQSSGQFSEEMRQMRNEARELAERQEQIRQQMEKANEKPRTLSDSGRSDEIAKQLAEQKNTLTNLLDQMKKVTEQSEVAEPLLSKELYDTLRKSSQSSLDQSLSTAQELVNRSFIREAQPFERRAGQQIDSLKRDVEKAAEQVLGDETESLRNARRELDQLTQQLESELARAATTNGGLSNALASARGGPRGPTNGFSSRSIGTNGSGGMGTNGTALSLRGGAGTNGTNIARGQAGGGTNTARLATARTNSAGLNTNQSLVSTGTNGTSGGLGGTNGQGRQLAATDGRQPSPGEGRNENAEQPRARGEQQQPGEQQGQSPGEGGGAGSQEVAQTGDRGERSGRGGRAERLAQLFDQQPRESQQEGGGTAGGPLTGEEFRDWSQRLSNVEEMVDRPALRNQIAQARDRARAERGEFKRHSKEPRWDLVRMEILAPLVEVRDRLADEISRRESSDSLAPIDRDPVPGKYGDLVRRYYENLGGGQ